MTISTAFVKKQMVRSYIESAGDSNVAGIQRHQNGEEDVSVREWIITISTLARCVTPGFAQAAAC